MKILYKDIYDVGYLQEELCPVHSIIQIEDVRINLSPCETSCNVSLSVNNSISLADIEKPTFLDMKLKCDGRQRCENLFLQLVECCYGGREAEKVRTSFKRLYYRCIDGK